MSRTIARKQAVVSVSSPLTCEKSDNGGQATQDDFCEDMSIA